jgi:hypothetical protein
MVSNPYPFYNLEQHSLICIEVCIIVGQAWNHYINRGTEHKVHDTKPSQGRRNGGNTVQALAIPYLEKHRTTGAKEHRTTSDQLTVCSFQFSTWLINVCGLLVTTIIVQCFSSPLQVRTASYKTTGYSARFLWLHQFFTVENRGPGASAPRQRRRVSRSHAH